MTLVMMVMVMMMGAAVVMISDCSFKKNRDN
jgi:hypothetical protein